MKLRASALCLGLTRAALACEPRSPEALATPIDDVGCHVVDGFTGSSLWLHGAAIGATLALSPSGLDHAGRRAFDAPRLYGFADAMVVAGFVGPPALGVGAWTAGLATGHRRTAATGAAAIQAMTLTFVTTVALKVGTGRPYPLGGYPRDDRSARDHPDIARTWRPPSTRDTAWPSGHASVAFAFAASVATVNAERPIVGVAAYTGAVAISTGMLVGVHHFPSDVLAGALLGQAIGASVGRGFRGRRGDAQGLTLLPVRLDGGAALVLSGAL